MTKVCFVCSPGGHLNQIKELIGKVKYESCYFVTLDKSDARSILKDQKAFYVTDTGRNPINIVVNFFQSLGIFVKNQPDLVITTGAGAALFTCYIAKFFGKKVILIESFSRVEKPSFFGKLVYPISNLTLLQWKALKKYYKKGIYVGPIFSFKAKSNIKKKKQIFVTVGASQYPFDRLLKEVDKIALKIKDYKIIAQIGPTKYEPQHYKFKPFYTVDEMNRLYEESEIVICHAGTGSIISALTYGCKTILVPRCKEYKEIVDTHQIQIMHEFENKMYILATYKIEELQSNLLKINNTKFEFFKSESKSRNEINRFINNLTNIERESL
jgi:UDP-N-acetylglucosamine transferase subunit ALG13